MNNSLVAWLGQNLTAESGYDEIFKSCRKKTEQELDELDKVLPAGGQKAMLSKMQNLSGTLFYTLDAIQVLPESGPSKASKAFQSDSVKSLWTSLLSTRSSLLT